MLLATSNHLGHDIRREKYNVRGTKYRAKHFLEFCIFLFFIYEIEDNLIQNTR